MADDAVHAILWQTELLGDIRKRNVAVERDQAGDVELGDDFQGAEIVLDLFFGNVCQ